MPIILGNILDSAGEPANGRLYLRQTSRFDTAAGLVTQAQYTARVVNGVPLKSDADAPLTVPPTPEGQALEIVEDFRDGRTTSRSVTVPSTESVTYAALVDVQQVVSSGEYVVPPWAAQLQEAASDTAANVAAALQAKVDAQQARADAIAAANSVPTEEELTATIGTALEVPALATRRPVPAPVELPLLATPPRLNNLGPNAAVSISNSVFYPVWVLDADGTTQIVNPSPAWSQWGCAHDSLVLYSAGSPGGPYLRPGTRGPWAFSYVTGPVWRGMRAFCSEIEYDYLATTGSQVRFIVDGKVLAVDPVDLAPAGGGQMWRYRLRFGLDTMATPALAPTTGGTLAVGTYRYRVTAVDGAGGETAASAQGSITLSGGNNAVNVTWVAPGNLDTNNPSRTIAGYKVYRTQAGSSSATEMLLATVAAGVLTYLDNGSVTPAGAMLRLKSSTSGRRERTIIIEEHKMSFGGITANAVDSIRPLAFDPYRVLVLGDSLSGGTGAGYGHYGWPAVLASRLGITDVDVVVRGGAGFIAVDDSGLNGAAAVTALDLAYEPDLIIVGLGINDVANTAGQVQTAVENTIDALRANVSATARLIILAPWWKASAPVGTVGQGVKAACAAKNVLYIDSLAEKWMTGTGTVVAPTGDGNADFLMGSDTTHWIEAGHRAMGGAAAEAIVRALTTLA